MNIKSTAKILLFIAIVLVISIFVAMALGTAGFLGSFLLFGDGSTLYFWLKKLLPIEPYVFVALAFSVIGFFSTWALSLNMYKNKLF